MTINGVWGCEVGVGNMMLSREVSGKCPGGGGVNVCRGGGGGGGGGRVSRYSMNLSRGGITMPRGYLNICPEGGG